MKLEFEILWEGQHTYTCTYIQGYHGVHIGKQIPKGAPQMKPWLYNIAIVLYFNLLFIYTCILLQEF